MTFNADLKISHHEAWQKKYLKSGVGGLDGLLAGILSVNCEQGHLHSTIKTKQYLSHTLPP